nr:hypothetical protein B0A51_05407 [Rachicladosporium sp. CCFEE 5018]
MQSTITFISIGSRPDGPARLRGGDDREAHNEESTFKQALKIGRLAQQVLKPTTSKTSDSHHRALLTEVLDLSHGWLRIADEETEVLERALGSSAPRDASEEKHRGIAEKGAVKLATSLAALGWKVMKRGKSDETRLEVLREIRAWIREWVKWGEGELEALDRDRKRHEHKHRRRHRRETGDTGPHHRPPATEKFGSEPYIPTAPRSGSSNGEKYHAPAINGVRSDHGSSHRYRPAMSAQQPFARPQHATPPIFPQSHANSAPSVGPMQQAPPHQNFSPLPNTNIPLVSGSSIPRMQPPPGLGTPGLQQQPIHTAKCSELHTSLSDLVTTYACTYGLDRTTKRHCFSRAGATGSHVYNTAFGTFTTTEHGTYPGLAAAEHNAGPRPGYAPTPIAPTLAPASGQRCAKVAQPGYAVPGQQPIYADSAGGPYVGAHSLPTGSAAASQGVRPACASAGPAAASDTMPGNFPGIVPPDSAHGTARGAPVSAHSHRSAQQARSQASSALRVSDWMESLTNKATAEQVPVVTSPAASQSAASSRAPTARQDYAQVPHVDHAPLADPAFYQNPHAAPQSISHDSAHGPDVQAPPGHADFVQEQGPGYRPETTAASSTGGSNRAGGANLFHGYGARTGSTRSSSTARPRMQEPILEQAPSYYSTHAPSVYHPQPMPTQYGQRAPSQHSRQAPSHRSSAQTAYRMQAHATIIPGEPVEPIATPAEEEAESEVSSAHFRGYEKPPPKPRLCRHEDGDWNPVEQGSCTSEAESCQLTPSRTGIDWDHKCVICDAVMREAAARTEEEERG